MFRKDNYRARILRRQAWRTGAESDGTQLFDSDADAADMNEAGWTEIGATATANSDVAPNSLFDASLLTEDTADSRHNTVTDQANVILAGNGTASIYVRRASRERRFFVVLVMDSPTNQAESGYFDTVTGHCVERTIEAGTGTILSAMMFPARWGWWKLVLQLNTTANVRYVVYSPTLNASTATTTKVFRQPSYQGASAPVYMWRPKITQSLEF